MDIGRKTTIGEATFNCGESYSNVKVGNDCMFSRNIIINTSDFHSIIDIEIQKRINKPQDIIISDHVWLGYNSRINKGALIRKDSVVAAQSVVPGKEFPANCIIAGIPAKVIREGITWDRRKL